MYYLRFADLITDADLCEMSVPFTCDRRIVQPGSLSFDVDIPNEVIGAKVAKIIPQRTIAHVYRDDIILGSYVIWSKKLSSDSGSVKASFQGATLESVFYSRRLSTNMNFTGQEQLIIADTLIADAQAGITPYTSSGNLSLTSSYVNSGILRDRSYLVSDGKFIGDLLEELANVDAGFEYTVHVYDNGTSPRVRKIFMAYPGIHDSLNPFVIEEPGCILSWEILYDGMKGGNVFWTRGGSNIVDPGADQAPILSLPYFSDSFLANGFPIIERIYDYQSVSDVSTLNKYAAWWAKNRSGPLMIPAFNVDPTFMFNHGFSPFSLGSNIAYVLSNPAFPTVNGVPTMSGTARVIGFEIQVDVNGSDRMNLIIETEFDPTDVV